MLKEHETYAVVDLEATGTGVTAKIIQVGVVIIAGGQVVETYETDVNPHEPLDQHIKDLTGLSDEQLAQAPTFSQVAGRIYDLIKNRTFVAHNVQFDANLLAEHLFWEGYELLTPRIDTVELAQVCFPTLDKYSLSHLAEELELPLKTAHRALDDALATAQLLLTIKEKVAGLPKLTLRRLAALGQSLIYETGQVFEQALGLAGDQVPPHLMEVEGVLVRRPINLPAPQPLEGDFKANIKRLGLSDRPQQVAFADLVAQGYDQPGSTVIEGEAGLGKTYGYLLPLLARAEDRQLLVAVPTKFLQDQLMGQEAARLSQVFGTRFCSLKSPRNYLDLERFLASLKTVDSNRLINRFKMHLLVWLLETETGDLDDILQKQGLEAYFDRLSHCGDLDERSPVYEADFWRRATEQARQSQVVVTNHAFLLASLQDKPNALANKVLVVDEAQRFFLAMEASSRQRLDITQTLVTINQLLPQEKDLIQVRLLESIQRQLNQLLSHHLANHEEGAMAGLIHGLRQDLSELNPLLLSDLRDLVKGPFADFWLERTQATGKRQTDLVGASLDFLQFGRYLTETTKAYFISATVAISKRVNLPDLLGLSVYETYSLGNSRATQQAIWVDSEMPEPKQDLDEAYLQAITERLQALASLDLPVLVLLTAKQTLLALSDRLEAAGLSHLAQGKHGDARQVKRRFDKGEQSLLLGMGAFWEGADFADQEQLILVVPKLPFDNPKEPFVKKINRQLTAVGKQPFYDYALPLAALRLKQALGRGRRSAKQRSALVLLDSRLVTKPYGKSLLKSLNKQAPIYQEKMGKILSEIKEFCYNGKE